MSILAEQPIKILDITGVTEPQQIIYSAGKFISIIMDGKSLMISSQHSLFSKAVRALENKEWVILFTILEPIDAANRRYYEFGDLKIKGSEITFRGKPIHGSLVERIMACVDAEVDPAPYARFMERLENNPDPESRNELFDFMKNQGLHITERGTILAYKSVRPKGTTNYKGEIIAPLSDWHTGTVRNLIGVPVSMERKLVDSNRRNECSRGYHIGAWSYVKKFMTNGIILLVEADPADVVCVPLDYDAAKCRVCTYVPVEVYCRQDHNADPLPGLVYMSKMFSKTGLYDVLAGEDNGITEENAEYIGDSED